jgi:excisionase family DNA binding protein
VIVWEDPVTESVTSDDKLLVTPEEASRRLSVGRTTIYELMASGELQSVSIGRCRRVPVISLSSFVNRLIGDATVEPRVPPPAVEREAACRYADKASHEVKCEG